jgi:two-component system, NtrC family, response regulator GlrR
MEVENEQGTLPGDRRMVYPGGTVPAFRLTVVEGPDAGTTVTSTSERCTIGAHARCDMVLTDPRVSRFHCEIRIDAGGARLRDTGSLNGTYVDGLRVLDVFVRDGSRIWLGKTVLRFELTGVENRVAMSESHRFGPLVAVSQEMRQVFRLLETAAASDATVLLGGETGTGKSAMARAIHQQSARAHAPFVMVDCAAIPATLLESEIFGHERGAFTDATSRRIGAFEEATGGTLFLDEIGELPLALQPKFLTVVESRSVRRLGSATPVPIDVRLIAATNRDLRSEVNQGRFRPDLYYRLAVVQMSIPPLRSRPDDLEPIARQILATLGAHSSQIERILNSDTMMRIQQAPWPGNVRELRNYLERCLIFDEPLPLPLSETGPPDAPPPSPARAQLPFGEARSAMLARFEREYVAELLRRHAGRVVDAAEEAEIDRTHLYRLMRRHGLGR